jgi:hypothetical protein
MNFLDDRHFGDTDLRAAIFYYSSDGGSEQPHQRSAA